MLTLVIIWIVCAVAGYWSGSLLLQSAAQRHLDFTDRCLMRFPLRIALYSVLFAIGQWLIVMYLTKGTEPPIIWSVLLPAYLLTPVTLVLMASDARWHLLPNRILYPTAALIFPLVSVLAIHDSNWVALLRVWVLGLGVGILLLIASFFGLGMGDVKLGAILAAWLGLYGWFAPFIMLFLASVLAGVYALVAIASRKANLRSHLAFGPWLICAAYLTWIAYLPALL
ncbi:MAG: prepilin peptidase [Mobiluncus porci]|uniref:prepilin peptidase n=1 Tax=Mobiluncus porci TaxID=2652278 RepID=UPI0023F364C6|nr:prepilin peptidase [Mobiluncus porci]MDD7541850.1 prepilin peptidase [Mobiluncus porci]MDY5748698.1 prepilin peptidase [Mobiluncus porci]